ncbi:hypothetical protein, partial [Gordonibacter urolithinfaciens]|uniref:hypothetical protein n=1 Tax=Gordonibacter urolithinfaciens TaxID=1335613 RepID=UPI003A8FC575
MTAGRRTLYYLMTALILPYPVGSPSMLFTQILIYFPALVFGFLFIKKALRWFLWERFRHRPSSAGENNDLELKRPREGPFPRHPPMIAKPNS